MDLLRREPVAVAGFIQAVIALVILFGVDITAEQAAGIMGVVAGGLALVVRANVSPTASPTESEGRHEGEPT